jgi:hypothetical protein
MFGCFSVMQVPHHCLVVLVPPQLQLLVPLPQALRPLVPLLPAAPPCSVPAQLQPLVASLLLLLSRSLDLPPPLQLVVSLGGHLVALLEQSLQALLLLVALGQLAQAASLGQLQPLQLVSTGLLAMAWR